jgi:HEPN domain-containing protein
MKKTVKLWIERAEYDWGTASVMISSGRYLYVAFMCQQSLEKLLKGYLQQQTDKLPPPQG